MGQHRHPKTPLPPSPLQATLNPALSEWIANRAQKANLSREMFVQMCIELGVAVVKGSDMLVNANLPANATMVLFEWNQGKKIRIFGQLADSSSGLILPGKRMD